jgi:hypothetical protein
MSNLYSRTQKLRGGKSVPMCIYSVEITYRINSVISNIMVMTRDRRITPTTRPSVSAPSISGVKSDCNYYDSY